MYGILLPNDSRTKTENKRMILIVVERLKEKIQNVDNEDDSLAHKATLKENSPFTPDNYLITIWLFKAIPPFYQLRDI